MLLTTRFQRVKAVLAVSDHLDMNLPRWSDRFSGTSHLLLVLLVAAVAAAFPVTLSSHASGSQTAAAPAVGVVRLTGSPLVAPLPGESRWAASSRLREATASAHNKAVHNTLVVAHPKIASVPAPAVKAVAPHASSAPVRPVVTAAQPTGFGCSYALAYLSTHSAPGFTFECPGYALGHQAMTCVNIAGVCAGEKLIAISIPCAAAYMNEASNSWVLSGLSHAPIDPYGYCQS
jgi:hypothetical protein